MKIIVLKLACLLLLLLGVTLIAMLLGWTAPEDIATRVLNHFPPDGTRPLWRYIVLWAGSLLFVGIGFYGLLPVRRGKTIAFSGGRGEVELRLRPIERSLNRIIKKMDEVRKCHIRVAPADNGTHAFIHAHVTIERQNDLSARRTANLVSDYIAETAKNLLGLEDLATVKLTVDGIYLNPKEAGDALRQQFVTQRTSATAETLEVPQPAISPAPQRETTELPRFLEIPDEPRNASLHNGKTPDVEPIPEEVRVTPRMPHESEVRMEAEKDETPVLKAAGDPHDDIIAARETADEERQDRRIEALYPAPDMQSSPDLAEGERVWETQQGGKLPPLEDAEDVAAPGAAASEEREPAPGFRDVGSSENQEKDNEPR